MRESQLREKLRQRQREQLQHRRTWSLKKIPLPPNFDMTPASLPQSPPSRGRNSSSSSTSTQMDGGGAIDEDEAAFGEAAILANKGELSVYEVELFR